MPGLTVALERIAVRSSSNVLKGHLFERMVRAALLNHTGEFRDRFSDVWLWNDYPDRDGTDIGIDLVASDTDGCRWAVQCKNYHPGTAVDTAGVRKFLAAASYPRYDWRLFVSTSTSTLPNTAWRLFKEQKNCRVLTFAELDGWPVDWTDFVDEPETLTFNRKTYQPRPYQQDAVDAIVGSFDTELRGKLILPCGTGKSVVALWAAERLLRGMGGVVGSTGNEMSSSDTDSGAGGVGCGTGGGVGSDSGSVLYVVPSISLLGQTMREWAAQRSVPHRYVGVCSDSSAGRAHSEDGDLCELSIPVTTDPVRIAEVLWRPSPGVLTVVFCTYQSLGVITEALKIISETQNGMSAGSAQTRNGLSSGSAQPQDTSPARSAQTPAGFDLMICDEAHRTTGVEKQKSARNSARNPTETGLVAGGGEVSVWQAAHHNEIIAAQRRLYMTATPRLYSSNVKDKARERQVAVYSMDDEDIYGSVFYDMTFKAAVDGGYLSDYEVAVIAVSDGLYANLAADFVAEHKDTGVKVDDVVKLLGCWDALADPITRGPSRRTTGRLNPRNAAQRAIAFCNTIKRSKDVERWWPKLIRRTAAAAGREHDLGRALLDIEIEHIDGTTRASRRTQTINALKSEPPDGVCRIVSNARCLTEGVDVPALDAVLFLEPRKSKIEIVQAVGRVMRTAPHKKRGYIVLPVIVPAGKRVTDGDFLRSSSFQHVWDTISALRAHDERMDVWVNTADMGAEPPISIITPVDLPETGMSDEDSMSSGVSGEGGVAKNGNGENNKSVDSAGENSSTGEGNSADKNSSADEDNTGGVSAMAGAVQMSLPLNSEIASVLVERCGDRRYWATWGADVAAVVNRIRQRIQVILEHPDRHNTRAAFNEFHEEMRSTINEHIQTETVIGMIAGHLVTLPVFAALFDDDRFARHNPVIQALDKIVQSMDIEGLVNETQGLNYFYRSVETRVSEIASTEGRLRILLELYESFFQSVEPKLASQIVYTPVELVDFICRSTDILSREHFGKGLTSEGVHILDPFAGTGTFTHRLLALPGLIEDEDLNRKYQNELHANEILPLAYTIAAVKIEQAYTARHTNSSYTNGVYQPFKGMVLTDTFEENPSHQRFSTMQGNSERSRAQAEKAIEAIICNPPWSARQRNASDDNPNTPHIALEQRIRETYTARSKAQLTNSLMDLYKMAIRWATDRIGERGVVGFVTPNGYLDGNAEAGMRACLEEEFSEIYIFNLRGNSRLQGEKARQEGGNVFGPISTRLGVAITLMVRNPEKIVKNRDKSGCRILYHDIGDHLTTTEKLQRITELASIDGISRIGGWRQLTPDVHHDWINQRNPNWATLIRLGHKKAKAGHADAPDTVFELYSVGINTSRDPYMYSFDCTQLADRTAKMIDFYEQRRRAFETGVMTFEEVTENDNLHTIKWTSGLKAHIKRNTRITHNPAKLRAVHYRPFVKQWLYHEPALIDRLGLTTEIFPDKTTPNQTIAISGQGGNVEFSALATDVTSDSNILPGCSQTFPRHRHTTGNEKSTFTVDQRTRISADQTTQNRHMPVTGGGLVHHSRRSTSPAPGRQSDSQLSSPTPHRTCISSPADKLSLDIDTPTHERIHTRTHPHEHTWERISTRIYSRIRPRATICVG